MTEEPPIITRPALLATLAFICAGTAVAALAPRAPRLPEPAVASRALVVAERPDGGVDLLTPRGEAIDSLEVMGDLFAITALRGVTGRVGAGRGAARYALELREAAGGRLQLLDPATGRTLTLEGFGADNHAVFEAYLAGAAPAR